MAATLLIPDSEFHFLLAAALFACIFAYIFQIKNRRPPLPPGPTPWPVIGNILELRKNKPRYKWVAAELKRQGSEIVSIRLGKVYVIIVSSPEIAREFLHDHDAEFASRPPANLTSELASYGFLTMGLAPNGEQWSKMRKLYIRELMSSSRLKWLHKKRNEEADNLVSFIQNNCRGNPNGAVVNLRVAIQHYCGNVIRKITFSKRYFGKMQKDGGPGEAEKEHVEGLSTLLRYMFAFCTSDYLPWLRFLDLDGHERTVKKAMEVMNKYHDPIIDERMKLWETGKIEQPEDLLDVMISLRDETGKPLLSKEEIRAQCTELFFPTDSPANAIERIIAEMINQPRILHAATKEIDNLIGKDRLVQESDLQHLNYLKACVKESLRLYPVAPFNLPHVATSDTVVAGYSIPKGSQLLLYRHGLGRNPRVWDEPLKYKPERHFEEGKQSNINLSEKNLRFVSFSTGRRGCPAISLGVEMTMMGLARLLQGFTWSAPSEEPIDLTESELDLFLAKSLIARAKPRLSPSLYPTATTDV